MREMEKRKLGNSDLEITVLGVGAFALGGPDWPYGWGPQDDGDSVAALRAALEAGVNWIDTAPVYGFGHAEEIVARAVKGLSPRPLIFTKCERDWNDKGEILRCLKAASIRKECEESLTRLQVDVIDLYQIHWPEPDDDIEEGWETLVRLREEGKVRHIGVSNFNVEQMRRAAKIAPITSLQPPYSLLNRKVENSILPYCRENNIGVIAHSPMRNGLLTGKMTRERALSLPAIDFRSKLPDFHEPRLTRNLELVERLRKIGNRHGSTPGEVAIAWVLRHSAVTGAIFGARNAAQVQGVIGAAHLRLGEEDLAELEPGRS